MDKPLKILFKLPSRGRPERFFKALDSITNNLQDFENYHVSCTLDYDDETMHNYDVIARIETYKNISVEWGLSNSKIHAVNRDIPDIEWDIICVGSDDIYFNLFGFDAAIRTEMMANFPDGDGYLHFNEKDSGSALCVMTCCDKKYYDRFGYIYHISYEALFCDNEQMAVAQQLGRYVYIPYSIMEHANPAYGYIPKDEMFERQQAVGWTKDMATFNERKAKNFDL